MIIEGFCNQETLKQHLEDKLKELKINTENYPICPYKIIKQENIILKEEALDINVKGVLMRAGEKVGILVNSNRTEQSQRFALCHELIHYWFHPVKEIGYFNTDEIQEDNLKNFEWQANYLAGVLLAPDNLLFKKFHELDGDINKISSFFNMSREALAIRLLEEKMIKGYDYDNKIIIYMDGRKYYIKEDKYE